MQATKQNKNAINRVVELMYLFYYLLDQCYVGNEGINHLCKAYWPNLVSLTLSNIFHYMID